MSEYDPDLGEGVEERVMEEVESRLDDLLTDVSKWHVTSLREHGVEYGTQYVHSFCGGGVELLIQKCTGEEGNMYVAAVRERLANGEYANLVQFPAEVALDLYEKAKDVLWKSSRELRNEAEVRRFETLDNFLKELYEEETVH